MSASNHKSIVGAARLNETAVVVEYSNNTSAIYTAAQLATLDPLELATEEENGEKDGDYSKGKVVQFPQVMSDSRQTNF